LAGLLDNSESRTLSRVPIVSDIPILGNLFKSKSFQKNETELMFIVTAHLVKPVERDDLPQMRGIDGLKNGSPLGLESKGDEIQGKTGFSVTGQNTEEVPAATPKANAPVKADEPKAKPATTTDAESSKTTSTESPRRVNKPLPVARAMSALLNFEHNRP
jgi:pilus assembly protein CpaC